MSGVATTTGPGGLASVIPLVTRGDGRDDAGRFDWFLGLDAQTGVLVADLQDVPDPPLHPDGSHHPVTGTTVLEERTWYHVAATYDGTTWRLYLNGRLEAERTVADLPANLWPDTSGTAPVGLGTAFSGDGLRTRGSFDGVLDETRIWSEARSATDIRHDLGRAVPADSRHLVAAWSMDEGAGSTLFDGSDARLDATLVGDPGWIDSPIPDDTIPGAPGSLTAAAGTASIALDWPSAWVPDLAGYNVYRSTTSPVTIDGEPLNGAIPITGTAYVDHAVTAGTVYHYAVTAVDRYANESGPSQGAAAALTVDPGASPTPSPTPTPIPALVDVQLTLTTSAPADGRHRIDPSATMTATVGLTTPTELTSGLLILAIPAGWSVTEPDGGILDTSGNQLTWDVAGTPAGTTVTQTVGLLAPAISPIDGSTSFKSTFAVSLAQAAGLTAGPEWTVLVAPLLVIGHSQLAQIAATDPSATYLEQDTAILDQQRFDVFRVRFQLGNADDLPVLLAPQLEFRPVGQIGFEVVPAFDSKDGVPFYVAEEWTPLAGPLGGSVPGPADEAIGVDDLQMSGSQRRDPAADPRPALHGREPDATAHDPRSCHHRGRVQRAWHSGRPVPGRL